MKLCNEIPQRQIDTTRPQRVDKSPPPTIGGALSEPMKTGNYYYEFLETELGPLVLAGNEHGLGYVNFQRGKQPLSIDSDWQRGADGAGILKLAREQLLAYFNGRLQHFDLPLQLRGTDFQRRVWEALQEIPYGEIISYGELARRIDKPKAVRAVGAANGRNAIAIVIPCHRVIGGNGSLTGYAGGLAIKQWLLRHERYAQSL